MPKGPKAKGPRPGRKAFKGFGPKGTRIRMMEPGEAESLFRLRTEAMSAIGDGSADVDMAEFVTFLVTHEIFVAADKKTGALAGYAAAVDRVDFYLVREIAVAPRLADTGIHAALLDAVTQRARWYYYRCVALLNALDSPKDSSSYDQKGFMKVSRKDLPVSLQEDLRAIMGCRAASANWLLHVKWL